MPLQKIKFLLQLKFHSRRSLENLFAWIDIEDRGRGKRGVVKKHTVEFWGHRDALERIKCHQDQNSSNQHACGIYGCFIMSIHRSSYVRAGVNRKQHRDWVHMRPEYFDGMQMHEDFAVMAAVWWDNLWSSACRGWKSSLWRPCRGAVYRLTLCTWYMQHSQDFHTRVQYMCN